LQAALGAAYRIERELGGGGMSRVFVAYDESLGRRVVVKVLREDVVEGISRERFRREVLTSANLQHPNIVGVIAAGDADGLPYFVMPFVEGESLRALLRRDGVLSIPNGVAVLRDVARALAFAHSRGIVHRDIKPDNVLLAGGVAVVADFGVAKAVATARASERHPHGSLTGAGMSLGTPAYMSPEQVAGDPTMDHRADIYAFGATAYEMFTGQPLFANRSVAEQMSAHLVERPAPVSSMRPEVPEALDALVARCLEKEPSRRPQAATEILALLDDPAVVSGQVASSSTPSLVVAQRRRRTWPRYAALAAIVAALGLVAVLSQGADPVTPAASVGAPAGLSVAVFPLVSISVDSGDRYIAEGMTEALTNALASLPGTRVASRSAAPARSVRTDAGAVASRLGVSMYMEGTVQRSAERLRVTLRLVSAVDGFTVWSDVYDRTSGDLLAAQSEIASGVADAMRRARWIRLLPTAAASRVRRRPRGPAAAAVRPAGWLPIAAPLPCRPGRRSWSGCP
jgi:serine/threonine-protein kinase